ncbi:MAG: hypothetical protein ACNS61_16240 [Candidatus Wenzhouxiangella sp. M2_3B_020]|jgi:hypothetical protein
MKKTLLIAAFGLMASPALAQSNATTNQTGTNNDAEVIQTGGAMATVNQGQAGTPADNNEALVSQSGTNETLINQFGSTNDAQVMQGVRPDGTDAGTASGNYAEVEQTGSDNSGLLDGADDDGSVIAQGVNGDADGAQAFSTQSGTNGRAQIYQGNNDGTALNVTGTINQAGDDNVASVRQGVMEGEAEGSEATITQEATASSNQAFIRQGADGEGSISGPLSYRLSQSDYAEVTQRGGDDNEVYIGQGADGFASYGSVADVLQDGASNVTTINQASNESRAYITSVGNSNEVTVDQNMDADPANNGGVNQTSIYIGGSSNVFNVAQDGHANGIRFDQNGGVAGDFNTINLTQAGSNHGIRGDIDGSSNMVDISQSGTDNDVLVSDHLHTGASGLMIAGDSNDIDVVQSGAYGTAEVAVTNDGNFVDITQTRVAAGAGSGDAATAVVDGTSNTAVIVQN